MLEEEILRKPDLAQDKLLARMRKVRLEFSSFWYWRWALTLPEVGGLGFDSSAGAERAVHDVAVLFDCLLLEAVSPSGGSSACIMVSLCAGRTADTDVDDATGFDAPPTSSK